MIMPDTPFYAQIQPGDIVFNLIGHRYQVLAGGPWLFRVQALTSNGREDVPIGAPFAIGRSEIDATRLPR